MPCIAEWAVSARSWYISTVPYIYIYIWYNKKISCVWNTKLDTLPINLRFWVGFVLSFVCKLFGLLTMTWIEFNTETVENTWILCDMHYTWTILLLWIFWCKMYVYELENYWAPSVIVVIGWPELAGGGGWQWWEQASVIFANFNKNRTEPIRNGNRN